MESKTTASNSFLWSDVDWQALRSLRTRFLQFDPAGEETEAPRPEPDRSDYWKSLAALESYDFTFGERIGWKWDTVIEELKQRGWTPPGGTVLDWACGTGIAGRRVVRAWPEKVTRFFLSDRSTAALDFAVKRAREHFPQIEVSSTPAGAAPDLLVISHVINELSPEALEGLLALVEKTQAVLWVEPGTSMVSRQLIAMRERLRDHFHIITPCTHIVQCGMLAKGNERHWCHQFARVPGYVHTDSGWGHFSATLDIDLGTLPYSFLVLDKRPGVINPDPDEARVIGFPRFYKGYAKILSCQTDGVNELTLQKRDAPEFLKAMKKDSGSLYRWRREEEKIRDGERLF